MFFRGCDENMKITEELLEMIPMHGESMFNAVWSILKKFKIPLDRLVDVTTDGAKAMVGKQGSCNTIKKTVTGYLSK